jgi:large subunit ribosomal protein L30
MSTLKIKLVRSTIKASVKQKATVAALGLHKVGHTVEQQDNVQTRGMLDKVAHLVCVEEN